MTRPHRVRLDDQCTLGASKINAVTTTRGSDVFECIHCGKEYHLFGLQRPRKHGGPCLVSRATRDRIQGERAEEEERRKRADPNTPRLGGWSFLQDGDTEETFQPGQCYSCNGPKIVVPRKGHPNSPYWKFERPGEVLTCCAGDCLDLEVRPI